MSLVDSLDRWTESARLIFPAYDDLGPPSAYVPITFSWFGSLRKLPLWGEEDIDEAFSHSREVLHDLRGYLAAHQHDLAVRWAVLAFLYDLSQEPADEDDDTEWGSPDRDEEDRAPFREELEALVSLAEIADLTEPKRVRWEIQNSCLVSDFGRAERLFRRLEEVQKEIEPENGAFNYALLGEFHLLRALSAGPTDLGRSAVRLPPPATRLAVTLARWGVAVDDPTVPVDESRLEEARHWFEKARMEGFSLPGHAAAALGRCLFIEKNYQRAAEAFQGILDGSGVALEGEQAGFNDELNAALHLAVARSHEKANELAKAKVVLEKCLEAFPKYGPAFRRLAELFASDTDIRGASEVLARWAEAEPQLESDIWVRALLGLGGIKGEHAVQRMLDEFFGAHPERLQWVEGAVKAHWSALDRLSEKAKSQWLYGCWILWWRPPGYEALDHATAAEHFSRTLEIELRERVFTEFVNSRGDLADIKADLDRPETRLNARGRPAWKRLLQGKATLGDMLTELDPSRASVLLASTKFREWLKGRFPQVVSGFVKEETDWINRVRTASTHDGEETRARAEKACRLCRKYVEYLL